MKRKIKPTPNAEVYENTLTEFGQSVTSHVIKMFERLEENGVNYSDAARRLGITPRTGRMYRAGTIKPPYLVVFALQMLVDDVCRV